MIDFIRGTMSLPVWLKQESKWENSRREFREVKAWGKGRGVRKGKGDGAVVIAHCKFSLLC